MKIFNIIPKAPQVRLKRGNNKGIRRTLCYAAVLLGVVALLIGCPDDAGNGGAATPTEATQVQSSTNDVTAISANSITLNWTLPTDIDGYMGVTISEEFNSGSLSEPVELDDSATEYQVTRLSAATTYTFTIATRYVDGGKNNRTMVMATTASATGVQNVAIDADETTSDSVTITWGNPADMDGYTGVTITAAATVGDLNADTPRMLDANTNTLTISTLKAEMEHTFTLDFATQYDTESKNSSSAHPITVTTQSNRVTDITASDILADSITLTWTLPEDAGSDYQGVTITAEPDIPAVMEDESTTSTTISGLTSLTPYVLTITTRYSTANKNGGMRNTATIQTLGNPIDRDDDNLIDITSLEVLNNVRYNLDLGDTSDDGRYKESTQTGNNEGLLCGHNADTNCTGYELMRSLDFADAGSYDSGMVKSEWRPNNDDPAMATNAGWDPIGGNFASRFEGNGFTISNLYARNTDDSTGASIGLFDTIAADATVRSIGIADAALYGSDASSRDFIGGLTGTNNGSIIASYARNTTANGGLGGDTIGGLVGNHSTSHIIASYAINSTVDGGADIDNVGGLVGTVDNAITIANYASSGTISGSADGTDAVGGLVGATSNSTVITAIYSTNTANGGGGNNDTAGGLVGRHNASATSGNLIASYATGVADGGDSTDTGDRAYALYGFRAASGTSLTDSYGFGAPVNSDTTGGSDGSTKPTVDGTTSTAAITTAEQLTTENVPDSWNEADSDTLDAWDFSDDGTEIPALRYADYDGTDTDYGCTDATNPTSTATIVIPPVVAAPGGPLEIVCGETLLPGQRP